VIAVDTNVLVYARRRETALHVAARNRLTALAEGASPWGIPVFCLPEFVRVVTHPRVFRPPTSLEGAFEFLEALLKSPTLRVLFPGPTFPERFRETSRGADARGNLAFDAQIAAVCEEHGALEIVTTDRDFARFSRLRPVAL